MAKEEQDVVTVIEDFEEDKNEIFEATVDASKDGFSGINIREKADAASKAVTTLVNGSKVKVDNVSMLGWAHVTTDSGVTGFALADYIKRI